MALFLLSSLSSYVVDLGALLVLGAVCSRRSGLGYVALAGALLLAHLALISGLTWLGVPLLAAELLTEVVLVAVSFTVQRGAVFRRRARSSPRSTVVDAGV